MRVASASHSRHCARLVRCTPARSATSRAATAAWARVASSTSAKRRAWPCSRVWPASSQPMVPLRKAAIGLGRPALINDWVPIRLRVRPAQLTMICERGSGASSRARNTSSAPGTLTPPGMLMVWYSSKRRASRMTTSASCSSNACTSSAAREGVWRSCSTSSPKALLGTLTSMNSSPPASRQPCKPSSSKPTSL